MSLPTLGLAVEDGVYTGTTSQGRPISLTVSGSVIDEYTINLSCEVYFTTNIITNGNCVIEGDGSFTCGDASCPITPASPKILVSGTFSDSSVSGSIDVAIRPCYPDETCGCCENSGITFNASLPSSAPQISIGDVVVTEGNSGTTSAQFDVTMNFGIDEVVTVDWETADGTANSAPSPMTMDWS